jgi:argininosuccinate synthase
MARPILAKGQVDVRARGRRRCVAHGCTGKGNDQVRFELAYQALAPELSVIAPWRTWEIRSREDALDYATSATASRSPRREPRSTRAIATCGTSATKGGALEDPATRRPTTSGCSPSIRARRPTSRVDLTLGFENGVPVALDGARMDPVAAVERLNDLGGKHGVGRVDICENRLVGMKSRGVYETPGGTIILEALRTSRSTRATSRPSAAPRRARSTTRSSAAWTSRAASTRATRRASSA